MARKTYTKVCGCGCGQSFTTIDKDQIFLNRRHYGDYQKVVKKGKGRGKENPSYKHGLCCEPRDRRAEKAYYSTETLTCPYCGKDYKVPKSEKGRRKYCSKTCFGKAMTEKGLKGFKKVPTPEEFLGFVFEK